MIEILKTAAIGTGLTINNRKFTVIGRALNCLTLANGGRPVFATTGEHGTPCLIVGGKVSLIETAAADGDRAGCLFTSRMMAGRV